MGSFQAWLKLKRHVRMMQDVEKYTTRDVMDHPIHCVHLLRKAKILVDRVFMSNQNMVELFHFDSSNLY